MNKKTLKIDVDLHRRLKNVMYFRENNGHTHETFDSALEYLLSLFDQLHPDEGEFIDVRTQKNEEYNNSTPRELRGKSQEDSRHRNGSISIRSNSISSQRISKKGSAEYQIVELEEQ